MNHVPRNRQSEKGVVSIFIVIFAAIFMTIITASFIELMITDQQQATTTDLSQNAYDSAMTGVEDAKRGLIKCLSNPAAQNCSKLTDPTTLNDCTILGDSTVGGVGVAHFQTVNGNNSEVPIQTDSSALGANKLDQAYTCVGMTTQSANYQGPATVGQPLVIPLQASVAINSVTISWNTQNATAQTNLPPLGSLEHNLLSLKDWTSKKLPDGSISNYPPALQATFIKASGGIQLKDFDGSPTDTANGAATLLLRPEKGIISSVGSFSQDARAAGSVSKAGIENVQCRTISGLSSAGPFTCSQTITLGITLNPSDTAFLVVTPIYQSADLQVTLKNGVNAVAFNNVQAQVDSTGRANDIFRRVGARVDLKPSNGIYPSAALNLGGSLCKAMTVAPGLPINGYTSYTLPNGTSTCQ